MLSREEAYRINDCGDDAIVNKIYDSIGTCKDCKHYHLACEDCVLYGIYTKPEHFCASFEKENNAK